MTAEHGGGEHGSGGPVPDADLLRQVPRGALVVAALGVAVVVGLWLATYLFLFLPRGAVG